MNKYLTKAELGSIIPYKVQENQKVYEAIFEYASGNLTAVGLISLIDSIIAKEEQAYTDEVNYE
jgi:hypothetical protein